MSALVSELIRAANATNGLSAITVERLLTQAIRTIRDLRRQSHIVPIPGGDALIYIRTVAAGADRVPREEWLHALLHAAEMLRDLSIVVDSGTTFRIVEA